MDSDYYQQAWQAQTSRTRVTVDADLLLTEVRRSQREFRSTIFWRDFREVGVGLLLLVAWPLLGMIPLTPWTWYLTMPVLVWMIGFMLLYRWRYGPKPLAPDSTLIDCARNSLTELENQIWLLRNVFWWYLLPPSISISAFFAHVIWLRSENWLDALGRSTIFIPFIITYSVVYWANLYAVGKQLEPRRQELLTLLASLGDETTNEAGKPPAPDRP